MTEDSTLSRDIEALRGLAAVEGGPVRDWRVIRLPASIPPWTETGLVLEPGDAVTWLASGRVHQDRARGLWTEPSYALWGRVGDGPIFSGTRNTTTWTASRGGPLALAVYHGEWATDRGDLGTPPEAYATLEGGFDVALIRWRGEAADGLAALTASAGAESLAAREAERLAHPIPKPPGWRSLWFLGENEIFRPAGPGGRNGITVHTRNDVGILQKSVSLPLTPDTELAWSWNIERLPATCAEHEAHLHDYLSIAVEFENGQDLTYYWSAELPEGTHFRCPLPTWAPRETHMAIRSGPAGLGRWHEERRRIAADYETAICDSVPERIVGVWLIAASFFQHGEGKGAFADIRLIDKDARVAVA